MNEKTGPKMVGAGEVEPRPSVSVVQLIDSTCRYKRQNSRTGASSVQFTHNGLA